MKVFLSCLKMNLCVYVKKVSVLDQGRRGLVCVKMVGTVWITLKCGGKEKRGTM